MLRLALPLALLAIAAPLNAAHAQTSSTTGQIEVKLLVTGSCEVSGSSTGGIGTSVLDFGTTALLLAAINADTGTAGVQTFNVLCNPGVSYTVNFGPGENATDVANRAMKRSSGTELVRYQLYTNAGRGTVLTSLPGVGTGTVTPIQVFGQVPVQTAPPVGAYSDRIVVTVSF